MCIFCYPPSSAADAAHSASVQPWPRRQGRRAFLLAAGASAAGSALAQVDVGASSGLRKLVPAETLETSARQQYAQVLAEARAQGALAPDGYPQLQRLHTIAQKLIPHTVPWNARSRDWKWQVNLINSKQINAWCMPGGKIAFYTGILDQLKLNDDEVAMIMGHEMAHALREHARERLAKSQATGIGLSIASQLLGLGQFGDVAANLGTQLLTLKYSRDDETESDLVGLEIAARGGYKPEASVSLWQKMQAASGNGSPSFLSTHPSGANRIQELQANLPKVQQLYEQARRRG
jgi:Zn-dependent protease with chaperone function